MQQSDKKDSIQCLGQWGVATAGCTNTFVISTASNDNMLIDCGSGVGVAFRNADIPLSSISLIFLSHCHADHISGIAETVFLRGVDARRLGVTDLKPLKIVANQETLGAVKSILKACYPDREFEVDYKEVTAGDEMTWRDYTLTFTKCIHTVPTNGLVLEKNGVRTGYTADTAPDVGIWEQFSGCQNIIVECFGENEVFAPIAKSQQHMTDKDMVEFLSGIEAVNVIVFHLHEKYKNMVSLREMLEGKLDEKVITSIISETQSIEIV